MEKIFLKTRAKINLNLIITGKREDGYHNIESVFQKINLYDELYIKKTDSNTIQIEPNIEGLELKDNIIYKAYMKMKEKYKEISGVYVYLKKNIPMQAGLAGGSTNCASFILGINKLFNLCLSREEIENLGKSLGADVVPCLYNKALKAEGIGDVITEIDTRFKYYIVMIIPKFVCNTKEMYSKLDNKNDIIQERNTKQIIEFLENENIDELAKNLYNVFEELIDEDVVKKLKKELTDNGAIRALMTGSGSCVYGLFKDKERAKMAYQNLSRKYKTFICTSYNSSRRWY